MTEAVQQAAIAAIGKDDPGADWVLRPKEHAAALPPEAGALARVLQSEDVRTVMERYTDHNRQAVTAQDRYKARSRLAIRARLGAIILLPIAQLFTESQTVITIGTVLQYACLGVALLITAWINTAGLFSRWMEARSQAELARLALFDVVMEASQPAREGELPLLPLKLDYIRRYQLDVQTRYYKGRGEQHQAAAGQSRRAVWGLNSLGVLAFIALIVFGADFLGLIDLP